MRNPLNDVLEEFSRFLINMGRTKIDIAAIFNRIQLVIVLAVLLSIIGLVLFTWATNLF